MTLIETMIAVFLSGLMVMPMMGWAMLALKEQANIEQRNVSSTSLGLLRTYFVRDVTNAASATTSGEALATCASGRKGEEHLLAVTTGSEQISYVLLTAEDGSDGLWRLSCPGGSGKVAEEVELLGGTKRAGTSATCNSAGELTEADLAAGVEVKDDGRGAAKVDPSKDKDANTADNDNGRGNDDKAKAAEAAAAEIDACRRVTLQVTTEALLQAALTATVRSGSSSDVEDVEPPSAVAAATPTSGARRLKVQFVGKESSDPAGQALTYLWSFGDGTGSDEVNPVKEYTAVGEFTATLTVTNESGLSSSATVAITVSDNAPVAVISAPAGDTKVFRGQKVAFSSAGSNDDLDKEFGGRIVGHAWDFGDGTTSTEANPTKQYASLSPEGGYTVKLAVFDDAGQTASTEMRLLVVNRTPTVSIVSNTTTGPAPLTVDFSSIVVDEPEMSPAPALTYEWDFGEGDTSTLADPPPWTFRTAGTWDVTLTVTDDQGATASASTTVTTGAPLLEPSTGLRRVSSGRSGQFRFMNLRWDARSGASLFEVRLRCDGCKDLHTATSASTTVRVDGLRNTRTYYFASVRARNSSGAWGPWSPEIRVRS